MKFTELYEQCKRSFYVNNEQNLRLQQEKLNFSWHSSTHEQQQQQHMPSSPPLKISNSDTKNLKSK